VREAVQVTEEALQQRAVACRRLAVCQRVETAPHMPHRPAPPSLALLSHLTDPRLGLSTALAPGSLSHAAREGRVERSERGLVDQFAQRLDGAGERLPAMADLMLLFGRQFGHVFAAFGQVEDRIVAEAVGSAHL